MSSNNIYFASKPRYEILDGLRGVAAMLVVVFHLFETYSAGPGYQIINHGYLAVDFFFVLSGFVIGYAYDDRWHKMSTWNFFKRRLVRLHPMVIMGTVIGTLMFYFTDAPVFHQVMQTPVWLLLGIAVLGCLMIPTPASMDIRGWQEMYSINGPAWSLLFEYIANVCYALFIRRFPKWLLAAFVACSALMTLDLTLDIDVTGLLKSHEWSKYTVIGGFGVTPADIYIGFTRLLYPFFAGLLISRVGKLISVRGGFWWCSAIVVLALSWPHVSGTELNIYDGMFQAVAILVVFPLVVAMGAGSKLTDKRSTAVCKFLGDISYPLYITHYPWIYYQMKWVASHEDGPLEIHIMVAVSIFIISVLIAYACLHLYDMPVREWLKGKLFSRS